MVRTIKAVCVGFWFVAAGAACMGPEDTEKAVTVALTLPGGEKATVSIIPGKAPGSVSSVEDGQSCEVAVSSDGTRATSHAASMRNDSEGSLRGDADSSMCSKLDATVRPTPPDDMGDGMIQGGDETRTAASDGCCIRCGTLRVCGVVEACCNATICCRPL